MSSFLAEDDRRFLDAEEEHFEKGKRRWILPVCVLAIVWILFGVLALHSIRQARVLATDSVRWDEITSGMPPSHWMRGTQASVHHRLTIALWGLIVTPLYSFIVVIPRIPRRGLVSFWRTVKYLENALADPMMTAERAVSIAGQGRPPKRGKSWWFRRIPSRPADTPPLDAKLRWRLYSVARNMTGSMKVSRVVLPIILPIVLLVLLGGPIYLALHAELPWYYGYERFITGYDATEIYWTPEFIVTDHAIEALFAVPSYLLIAFVPMARCRRLMIFLVAEMRRLDILLWRRAQRKD